MHPITAKKSDHFFFFFLHSIPFHEHLLTTEYADLLDNLDFYKGMWMMVSRE